MIIFAAGFETSNKRETSKRFLTEKDLNEERFLTKKWCFEKNDAKDRTVGAGEVGGGRY